VIAYIPTPLRSYTGDAQVEVKGKTVGAALADLDKRFPGLRFRIIDEHDRVRDHIKLFVGEEPTEDLRCPVKDSDVLHIICALSGGAE